MSTFEFPRQRGVGSRSRRIVRIKDSPNDPNCAFRRHIQSWVSLEAVNYAPGQTLPDDRSLFIARLPSQRVTVGWRRHGIAVLVNAAQLDVERRCHDCGLGFTSSTTPSSCVLQIRGRARCRRGSGHGGCRSSATRASQVRWGTLKRLCKANGNATAWPGAGMDSIPKESH